MALFILYLIKANLILSILFAPFFFFFKNEKFLKLNRVYLLITLICSLTLPLLPETGHFAATPDLFLNPVHLTEFYEEQSRVVSKLITNKKPLAYFSKSDQQTPLFFI